MVTVVLPSAVGKGKPPALSVDSARFVPKIEAMPPAATRAANPAPSTTPFDGTTGGGGGGPIPVTVISCGLPGALSLIATWALRVAGPVGRKVTVTVQVDPTEIA